MSVPKARKKKSDARGFTMVPTDFLRDGELSMAYRLAWAILRSYAWKSSGSTAKIAVQTLANNLGCDSRTARRLFRVLEDDKAITQKKRGGGRGRAAHYLVNDPPVKTVIAAPLSEKKTDIDAPLSVSQMSGFSAETRAGMSGEVDDLRELDQLNTLTPVASASESVAEPDQEKEKPPGAEDELSYNYEGPMTVNSWCRSIVWTAWQVHQNDQSVAPSTVMIRKLVPLIRALVTDDDTGEVIDTDEYTNNILRVMDYAYREKTKQPDRYLLKNPAAILKADNFDVLLGEAGNGPLRLPKFAMEDLSMIAEDRSQVVRS